MRDFKVLERIANLKINAADIPGNKLISAPIRELLLMARWA